MISAPVILYPKTNWTTSEDTYYTEKLTQIISGDIPVVAADIDQNTFFTIQYRYRIENTSGPGSYTPFSYTGITVGSTTVAATSIPWSFNSESIITYSAGDTLHFEFKTVKLSSYFGEVGPVLEESTISELVVYVVTESQIKGSANPVTGVKLKRYTDRIKVLAPESGILLNENADFAGCVFYLSLTAGGGSDGYVQMNDVLVTDVDDSETEETIIQDSEYTDTTNDLEVQTIKSHQQAVKYYTFTMNKSVLAKLVRENKIPNVFLSDGETLSEDVTCYFIVTAIAFDRTFNEAVESPYSIELEASMLRYSTDYQSLPKRSRSDILFSIARDVMANNELVNVIPGSVIRDVLDPVALEFEKFYVIQDFIFAALSVDTLLNYDDEDGDGESDPVTLSTRKSALMSALGITDPTSLQLLVDEQFDKLASNYNLIRKGATNSTGTVLFYTEVTPTQNILISDGLVVSSQADLDQNISSASFVVEGSQIIDIRNLNYYYNPTLRRYEVAANVRAQLPGSTGNVPAGTITVSTSTIPTVQVTSNAPTMYGTDRETNQQLANRIKLAGISYDSGTEGGYADAAYDVPGIMQARVEQGGDPLMMRDFDQESSRHIGGKVDIYIKGNQDVQFIDQVAFKYEYSTDSYGNKVGEQFYIVNASEFRIRSRNPKVTSLSPIVSVSRVRNITRNKDYDLQDIDITGDGDTLILEKNFQNNSIGMATLDVIEVNYLYRSSNSIVLINQPVGRIVSVTSSQGVLVDPAKYTIVKLEDPLQNGNSSIAKDSVKFFFSENDNIPEFITISEEPHTLLLDSPARLIMKGVDISTIVVAPESDLESPYIRDVDYSITVGDEAAYTYINLLPNSKIRHGDEVLVSYQASENFNITYVHNGLIDQVQEKANRMKHACADTIVKQAVHNYADISFRVVRKTGVDYSLVKSRIQTVVANYVSGLKLGEGLTQGGLISIVQGVDGVKEIKVPLIRMMKRNSSFIPLDSLGYLQFEIYQKTSANGVTSYRSVKSVLKYRTSDGGGDPNLFSGIYEDNILLTRCSVAGDVSKGIGRSYIQSDGKIIVSTTDGLPPQSKFYKAFYYTYYPADANPVEDLETSEIEYLDIDSLSLKDIDVLDEKIIKRGL